MTDKPVLLICFSQSTRESLSNVCIIFLWSSSQSCRRQTIGLPELPRSPYYRHRRTTRLVLLALVNSLSIFSPRLTCDSTTCRNANPIQQVIVRSSHAVSTVLQNRLHRIACNTRSVAGRWFDTLGLSHLSPVDSSPCCLADHHNLWDF